MQAGTFLTLQFAYFLHILVLGNLQPHSPALNSQSKQEEMDTAFSPSMEFTFVGIYLIHVSTHTHVYKPRIQT